MKHFQWISALLFAAFAFLLMSVGNSDYLYAVSEHSLFLHHASFFKARMAVPGGLIAWAGCYLTQFFHFPAIGTLMLIALWLLSYWLTLKAFDIKSAWGCVAAALPVLALLASVTSIGYWLYYNKIEGYWFKESLGCLLTVTALCGYRKVAQTRVTRIWAIVYIILWTIVGYFVAGWWALLGALVMVCMKDSVLLTRMAGIVSIAIIPWGAYRTHARIRLGEAWTYGFPLFQNDTCTSWPLVIPFAVIAITLLALALFTEHGTEDKAEPEAKPAIKAKTRQARPGKPITASLPCLAMLTAFAIIYTASFRDENYQREIRMYRATMDHRWTDVLKEAAKATEPTREIVVLKNLALMQKGIFATQYTKYANAGPLPKKFDHLNIHLVQTCGPLLYLHYGRANMATRWAMENEVEYGLDIDQLKCMILSAMISEEWNLADKYLKLIEAADFQDGWTKEHRAYVDNKSTDGCKELAFAKELHDCCGNILDTDKGMVEIYLINYFSHLQNTSSRLLNEVILNFTCLSKDTHLFWPNFASYVNLHQGEPMPTLFQEAAILYGNLENLVDISHMPFDKGVKKRFEDFNKASQSLVRQGKNDQQIGSALQSAFGDTFWWNYYFLRHVPSY